MSVAILGRRRRRGGSPLDPNLPPVLQGNLVLAPTIDLGAGEQVFSMLVGPDATLGSDPGADTNDPAYSAGPPALFTFEVDNYITWGDALESTWTGATGWTILAPINPSAGDVAADREILTKNSAGQRQFAFDLSVGQLQLDVFYENDGDRNDRWQHGGALTAGIQIAGCTFDPTQAREDRGVLYLDGALYSSSNTPGGTDGSIVSTTAELRLGVRALDNKQGVAVQRIPYVWNVPLAEAQIATATSWIVSTIGWEA